jgi:hypothetical protein
MMMDSIPFGHNVERRREILYGTPGTVLYRDGRPVLWIPDNLGEITKELSYKDLEALQRELTKYLKSGNPDEKPDKGG